MLADKPRNGRRHDENIPSSGDMGITGDEGDQIQDFIPLSPASPYPLAVALS
jgi:hypothetical protein